MNDRKREDAAVKELAAILAKSRERYVSGVVGDCEFNIYDGDPDGLKLFVQSFGYGAFVTGARTMIEFLMYNLANGNRDITDRDCLHIACIKMAAKAATVAREEAVADIGDLQAVALESLREKIQEALGELFATKGGEA